MSDSKLSCLLTDLASRTRNLKEEFSFGENEKFFAAIDAVLDAVKGLLASVDVVLDAVELNAKRGNSATPESMEISLSDVSTNTSGIGSANTSGLLDEFATSKVDLVGVVENLETEKSGAGMGTFSAKN
jgi:hypothetical protein